MADVPVPTDFEKDSLKWRHVILTGKFKHWCWDWDGLPVDETCEEFTSCGCFGDNIEVLVIQEKMRDAR